MQHKSFSIPEKIVAVISYFTMGILGIIWILIALFMKKRLRFCLMYHILQSIVISVFLAFFNLIIKIILQILIMLPYISEIGIKLNMFLQKRIFILGLSFSKIEIVVFLLLIYITIGILLDKNTYIPLLTKIMKRIMQNYR